jgi:MFS family permease
LASGIVWGFAALKPVLIARGVYRELCTTNDESPSDFSLFRTADDDLQIPCAEQDLRLNLFFIAASNTANVSTLLAGATLDRFGRRTCYIISSFFLGVGCILMGSAFAIVEFDGYILSNIFLALGGTFLFVPSFQLANAFPKHSGIVVALVTGAFDSSAAVFLFYRMAYEASEGRFSPHQFFFGYLIVPVLILLAELTFMPPRAYHSTLELEKKIEKAKDSRRDIHESDDEITSPRALRHVRSIRAEHRHARLDRIEELLGDVDVLQQRIKLVEERQEHCGAWGALHDVPTHQQMLTPWYILLLLLTILQMLRMNYFIPTIRGQYRYMLHSDEEAVDINHFFDAALPIAGVISTPFIGLLLNKLSITATLATLTVFVALLGTLNCLPFLWAGYATVLAFVIFRPFYYSVMS